MTIRIALGGATGWTGSAIARAIRAADDLELVSGVASSRPRLNKGLPSSRRFSTAATDS